MSLKGLTLIGQVKFGVLVQQFAGRPFVGELIIGSGFSYQAGKRVAQHLSLADCLCSSSIYGKVWLDLSLKLDRC